MKFIRNLSIKSEVGIVLDWKFHTSNRWVSIFAPYLVKAILKEFNPVIISSQFEYDLFKHKIKFIISMEPGWAAPFIKYDARLDQVVAVMASDPHNKKDWFAAYVLDNGIDYVLSQYLSPFFYHFNDFPVEKFMHFPWAVPDEFVFNGDIEFRSNEVAIFGARYSNAYDIRNWCRQQDFVKNYSYSGVEKKELKDADFFKWLQKLDAIVAAGSSKPAYDLVTPKYFEIPSSGALLLGQYCTDLESIGFNESNMVIFSKDNFIDLAGDYMRNPERYLPVRSRGRDLIMKKHLISNRIKLLKDIIE